MSPTPPGGPTPRPPFSAPALAAATRRAGAFALSLRDAVLGGQCGLCGAPGADPCPACRAQARLRERLRLRCPRCAEPLAHPAPLCARCATAAPPFARTVCAAGYAPPYDRIELGLKFGARAEFGATLGMLLADAAAAALAGWRLDCLVPVPLAPGRLAERGYNQAQLIARPVARRLRAPLRTDALLRVRATPPIAARDRAERHALMRGAFAAGARLDGLRIGVVDDVMTSGATLQACAQALLAAGAREVVALAALRTATE